MLRFLVRRSAPMFIGMLFLVLPARAAAAPQVVTCGAHITRDAVLPANLDCEDAYDVPAITIVVSGVTVDLQGHSLGRSFGIVVSAEHVNHVTVRDGSIGTQGLALTSSGHHNRFVNLDVLGETGGLYLHDGGHNAIIGGHIERYDPVQTLVGGIGLEHERWDRVLGVHDDYDLRLGSSRHVSVRDNTVDRGVIVDATSRANTITLNTITSISDYPGPSLLVQGSGNRIAHNTITYTTFLSGPVAPAVQISGRHNRVVENSAEGNPADGIDVLTRGNFLRRNAARNNGGLGISAVAHTRDGGGNRASGNGDPRQCVGVRCTR